MGARIKPLLVAVSLALTLLPLDAVAATPSQSLLINRIKTGGIVSGEPTEFLTIYNKTDQPVDLAGWMIEYAKPSAKITDCSGASWKQQDSSANVKETDLTGIVPPYQEAVIELSMNDNAGGALRLSNNDAIADKVGWGNVLSGGVCKERALAPLPQSGTSIVRKLDLNGSPIDTDDNGADFIDSTLVGNLPKSDESQQDGVDIEQCYGVQISEIVPNPAGTDTGKEYIELFNSTNQPVNLSSCSLKVGSTTKQLTETIQPGYQVIYGLTLPNAAGGSVEFITPSTESVVSYPPDMKDDESWSLIDGEWQLSNQSTPGQSNKPSVLIASVTTATTTVTAQASCPAGKYRNPATNRCKNIEIVASKACDSGQIRNPATNRCKKAVAVGALLKPCDVGQVRNPATNRCRKVTVAKSLAACKIGQERNTTTNRCRKVAGATTSKPNNSSTQGNDPKPNISYVVLAIVAALVLGYGVYEYRTSIGNYFAKLRTTSKA